MSLYTPQPLQHLHRSAAGNITFDINSDGSLNRVQYSNFNVNLLYFMPYRRSNRQLFPLEVTGVPVKTNLSVIITTVEKKLSSLLKDPNVYIFYRSFKKPSSTYR